MPLALLALAISAFGIGTTEFVMMGLLPNVADDLGTSVPTAGYLVSAYALGVVLGAPLLTAIGSRVPRKRMLLLLMALFTLGNLASALAPGFGFSWPASFPMARIDQIMVKGVEPMSSWTLPATDSDHLPIAARVAL